MKQIYIYMLVVLIIFSYSIELLSSDLTSIYPAPAGEILYEGYTVRINGQETPVYSARVSAFPLNQRWPGYQRAKYQTEFASFCSWDMNGPLTVEVIPHHVDIINQVVVRPQSNRIVPKIDKGTIVFSMNEPLQITVEVNGMHHALHLFGNPMEESRPDPNDPNVLYFAPGVYDIGKVDLIANQTVYIGGGAVVYGAFEARDVPNLTIRGRGILDGSLIIRPDINVSKAPNVPFGLMALYVCHNAKIEGITFRDANLYVIMPVACNNMSITNIKEIGMWRYNTDGIHLKNCQDMTIDKCFLRNFDDGLVVNGYQWHRGYYCGELPTRNITTTHCVIWNDWNASLRVGVVCDTLLIENIVFRDCDIIHASRIALNLGNHGRAIIRDILFEDIRIEMDAGSSENQYQFRKNQVYSYSNKTHVPQL
ncbi:MAG: hypothetical protein GY931_18395, partial [Maribacter sp.]|nr:hypothetical protein [Maribacter sp.]